MQRDVVFAAVLAASIAVVNACSSGERPAGQSGWTVPLRDTVLARLAEDQDVRDRYVNAMQAGTGPDSSLIAELGTVDSANTAWLRQMVARYGWPDRDTVGTEVARAVFLLVQHADRDTAFQVEMRDFLQAAFDRGQAEGSHVALLSDRIATARGQLQRYGTQASLKDGRVVFDPIEDSANVDARRKAVGLPPLAEYRRTLDSVYLGRRTP
jgi:hypothetical protein